ncbi:MAG: hypothetical protein JSR32_10740 [Proteobacteria bacterium]|nr:hypothetical protein [Pseudomonadota bacterium]
MSKETIVFLKSIIEQRKIKSKQLCALQTKESEETEKEAKLSKLLEQAKLSHDIYWRANLVGNASDQDLKESKINLKGLSDSLQKTNETLKLISETRTNLSFEIESLNGDIAVHRGTLCRKLAKEALDEMAANKKLKEKLADGYAAFLSSGDYDRSWIRFILSSFPQPNESDMRLAVEKLKANNDFMRD